MKLFKYLFVLIVTLYLGSCIKSSLIGDDLIKKDEILVDFTDKMTISGKSIKNDSFLVYPNSRNSYILGEINDAVFGNSKANLAIDFTTVTLFPDSLNSDNVTIDSLVLTLIVDTSYYFGDTLADHFIKIYELDENIQANSDDEIYYYSNKVFSHEPNTLAEIHVVPENIDSVTVIELDNDTTKYEECIRVRMPDELGKKIIADTSNLSDVELFKTNFKGIYITSETSSSSMIGISKYTPSGSLYSTRLDLYFSSSSDSYKISFPMSKFVPTFEQDYSNSEVGSALNDSLASKNAFYIQGLTGIKMEVNIDGLDTLADKNINKAELSFYTTDYSDEANLPARLIAFYEDEDGDLVEVEDYTYSDDYSNAYFYDAYPYDFEQNDITGKYYKLNLTTHFKTKLNNKDYSTKLYIYPTDRIGSPGFAKFYGTDTDSIRTKLSITYSDKN